jgi:hypothetical protein
MCVDSSVLHDDPVQIRVIEAFLIRECRPAGAKQNPACGGGSDNNNFN